MVGTDVLISEVGPRDSLQSVALTMPAAAKFATIDTLHAAGVRAFDASQGGLGACAYAPGPSASVVTGDLVFMFEPMALATGIDIRKRIAARGPLQNGLPREPIVGMTPEAGPPKGFVPASRGAHG